MSKDEVLQNLWEVFNMSLPWDDDHYEALRIAIEIVEKTDFEN